MTSPAVDPQTRAVEAARVAFQIANSYEHPGEIVVRTNEFTDAHGAITASLTAQNAQSPGAPMYRTLALEADHSIRGTHIHLEGIDFGDGLDGRMLVAVVTVHTHFTMDGLTQINVLSQIRREIHDACEESPELAPWITQIIFVIDEKH